MSYTIAKLKDDMARKLHGTTLNKLNNPDGLINEAIRQVLQDIDPAETKRTQQITNAIYDDIYDYQLPTDLKSNKIIDIYPQANRDIGDSSRQTYTQYFEKNKKNDTFYVRYNSGYKSLRYTKALTTGQTLSEMDVTTNWSVGGDASNLTKDTLQYISSAASLKFDLSGLTTSGYLENSSLDSLDLSDEEGEGALFLWCYLPDSSIFTSLNVRWGNDSSNYWDVTSTTPHDGTSVKNGWNLFRFDWNGASETGSPSSSAIDYSRITINYNGTADENIRLDNLVYRLGTIFNIDYYSKYLLQNSTGTWIEEVSDDSDIVNLDTDSYNVLLYKTNELMAQEVQGEDSGMDLKVDASRYQRIAKQYKMQNKSEAQKPKMSYYKIK